MSRRRTPGAAGERARLIQAELRGGGIPVFPRKSGRHAAPENKIEPGFAVAAAQGSENHVKPAASLAARRAASSGEGSGEAALPDRERNGGERDVAADMSDGAAARDGADESSQAAGVAQVAALDRGQNDDQNFVQVVVNRSDLITCASLPRAMSETT